jgi:hypothetical protein
MTSFHTMPARLVRALAVAALGTALFGCAIKMPPPQPSVDNLQSLRSANIVAAKTGSFTIAPGADADLDTHLGGLRGSSLRPAEGTFSLYLRDEIVTELKAAGLYDEASAAVIRAELTESKVDAAIGTGSASLGARFIVTRDGKTVYDKRLAVDSTWDSSFIGAVAIPAATTHYTALYKALAGKLFGDADFRAALAH